MSGADLKHRLAAILAADVAGYSRLMAADDRATVAALDAARGIFKLRIEANEGRVIDMAGDSVLAVFQTAAGAVAAAIEIQEQLKASDSETPEARRMRFRIGVHLGDVIEKSDGTIYGDGVNIAARLQALADPGGVSVSGMVQEAVRDRIATRFEDRGEHSVKNIARPVHVYSVAPGSDAGAQPRLHRLPIRYVTAAAVVIAVSFAAWISLADSARPARSALAAMLGKAGSQAQITRANIAVMPFVNQSGDAQRDYFSDGITEDVINALGRFSGLMVMSRNAVWAYKDRQATPAQVSRELGVRYIAQGSVRQAEGKLRVVVELSDAEKGAQLWSERYEGAGADVFDIQDRIVKNIVGALAVRLTRIEQQRTVGIPTDNLEAYDLVLQARALLDRSERGANRQARSLLARAQSLAPQYADVDTALAEAELQRALYGWVEDVAGAMREAEALCKRVLSSPDERAHTRAHAVLASIYSNLIRFDEALAEADRAIELNPSDSSAIYKRGMALLYVGRIDEAIAAMEAARRFDPQPGINDAYSVPIAYYIAKRYREGLAQVDALLARNPEHVSLTAIRAATLAQLGNLDEAQRAAQAVRRLNPMFQWQVVGQRFANPAYSAALQEGMQKAGL